MLKGSKETRIKKKKFLDAFEKSKGNVSVAARAAGVVRRTIYDWKKDDEELREAMYETIEAAGDFVESKLLSRINKNDTTAIIFFCKTKLKDRGYLEKTYNENTNINVECSKEDAEILKRLGVDVDD